MSVSHCLQQHQVGLSTEGDWDLPGVVHSLQAYSQLMACHTKANTRIARQYMAMRDQLTPDYSLLLKGSWANIPPALRQLFLHDLQKKNAGITKWQLTAKPWSTGSGLTKISKTTSKKCPTYIRLLPTLLAEPPINHNIPQGSWQKLVQILWIGMAKSTLS